MSNISTENSFLTDRARDYAALSDLAYAEWQYANGQWIIRKGQNDATYYEDLWDKMKKKGYTVIHYQPDLTDKSAQGTPTDSGYSGTLFSYQGKMILANRGSALINPSDPGDLEADKQIFARQLPTEQFLSMMAYINELKTIYQINLGTFDVTGHSLGGCLAQIAKAALSSEIDTVYTYNAPGAMNLTQEYFKEEGAGNPGKVTVKHWVGDPFSPIGFWQSSEWDVAAWNAYEAFFTKRAGLDDGKVFNVSGKDFVSSIADFGKDIGPEVYIDGSTHRIWHVQENLNNGRFFVDNRNPVTIIGSSRNETFFGDYSSGHYSGNAPATVTMVGGYGDDYLGGGCGNDELYGDLPREFDQAAIAKSGNSAGNPGSDILDGGKGDDILYGGPGDDTYYIDYGDGKDRVVDTEGNNKIIYGKQDGAKSVLQKFYAPEGGTSFWVTADGAIRFEQSSAQQIILPDGGTIVFQDSQASAFGIRLIDLPGLPSRGQTILGTSASEIMAYSTEGDDLIDGLAGDDDICARMGGNDWILGGEGSDILVSYNTNGGNDILEGGSGADLLAGGPGDDMVFAEAYGGMVDRILAGESATAESGKGEMLSGGVGDDYIYGSNRGDALFGGVGHDLIVGGGGDDAIFGDYDSAVSTRNWSFTIEKGTGVSFTNLILERNTFQGGDTIYAGTGNDFVYAGGGRDEVYGGEGDDTIAGEGGDDFITGDAGNDFLDGDASWVALEDHGDDYIDGGAGDDRIWGQGGSDELFGDEGKDTMYGGDGNDYLDGEAGDDTLYGGSGNDTIMGGDGKDWLQGDEGNDYLDGGAGENTLVGGDGNDILFGGEDKDHLQADAGDDYVDGGAGDDKLMGGAGNDELYGGDGIDTIWGDDTLTDGGNDFIEGGAGNDTIYGMAGDNHIWGDDGNDKIQGDDGNDFLDGGAGDDAILGGYGVDVLIGGDGNDALQGDAGDDYLDGGAGNDVLRGCSGSDTYCWGKGYGNDTIDNYGDYTPAGYLNGTDRLVFGEGLTIASFEFSAGGPYASDLVIRIKETGETLTLKDWLDALPDRLNTFRFVDGTELTAADIE